MRTIIFTLILLLTLSACSPGAPPEQTSEPAAVQVKENTAIAIIESPTPGIEAEFGDTPSTPDQAEIPATTLPPDPEITPSVQPETQNIATQRKTRIKRKLSPNAWKGLPVIPVMDESLQEVYQKGLEMGNDPTAYSKIGDCGSTPAWFMGDFDQGEDFYTLGKFHYLDEVIEQFSGSHQRTSLGARSGFNAPSLFSPIWSNLEYCSPDEGPLECEYRVHNPSYAFVMLGSNDVWHQDEFEPQMRKIIEFSINNGVIPILSTKADDVEGDGSINYTIASLADEYQIPLINFWRVANDLPDGGLQEDGVHLTWGGNDFFDPDSFTLAWPMRNLTALQALDVVWRSAEGLTEHPQSMEFPE